MQTLRDAVTELHRGPRLPEDNGELFAGYGVLGLPFDSGHYLALRVFPRTTIGAGYRTVWHREPDGRWTFYATEPPERSCPRYFGAALSATERTAVDVDWSGPTSLRVNIPGVLDWSVELGRPALARALSRIGMLLPEAAWRSDAVLSLIGSVAGTVLRAGHIGLTGDLPNGQHFHAAPRRMWTVTASSARLAGVDLGRPGPLAEQDRLGDFWLVQRGIFAMGTVALEALDPARHRPATPGRAEPVHEAHARGGRP